MTDIIVGGVVGISQVLIGHPFDTAKVLIQNKRKWFGLPFSLYYKGWRYPVVSSTLSNCTVFPVYERSLWYTNNIYLSGLISGIISTPLIYMLDVGKTREQTLQPIKLNHFWITYGKWSTLYRESLASCLYFGTYFGVRDKYHPLVSGGLSGLVTWTATYPIDVIRNRQLAQNITMYKAFKQGDLWKGYSVCAIRAIIVNATSFWVYELAKKYIAITNNI